jgi:hypothetical protein
MIIKIKKHVLLIQALINEVKLDLIRIAIKRSNLNYRIKELINLFLITEKPGNVYGN